MPKQVVIALYSMAVARRVPFSMVALVAQNGTNAYRPQKRTCSCLGRCSGLVILVIESLNSRSF